MICPKFSARWLISVLTGYIVHNHYLDTLFMIITDFSKIYKDGKDFIGNHVYKQIVYHFFTGSHLLITMIYALFSGKIKENFNYLDFTLITFTEIFSDFHSICKFFLFHFRFKSCEN